jgi:superfamily II DNA or RNA helicase
MAANPRRSRRRAPHRPDSAPKGSPGSLSPAFHHLLRCLTAPAVVPTTPASTWAWGVKVVDNHLCVRPVWVGDTGMELMAWTVGGWAPQRTGGWLAEDRLDLRAVQGTQPPEQDCVVLRDVEQMQAWLDTLTHRGAWLDDRQGAQPLRVGGPVTIASRWESNHEGGVTLVQEEGFSPRQVVFAGDQVWKLVSQADGWSLHPVTEGGGALVWAQKYQRLNQDDLNAWALRFADDARLATLPLPQTRQTSVVNDVPRLVARVINVGNESTYYLGMQLMVAYGDVTLSLHGADIETVTRADGSIAIVHRNRSVERRTLNAIGNLNLRVFPHPFSKRDAYPAGWLIEWLKLTKETNATWISSEPPPSTLQGWFALAQQLEGLGLEVQWDAALPFARAQSDQRWTTHVEPAGKTKKAQWLEAGVSVNVDGEALDLTAALVSLLTNADFPLDKPESEPDGAVWLLEIPRSEAQGKLRYLDVPMVRLRALLQPLVDVATTTAKGITRVRLPMAAINEVSAWPTETQFATSLQKVWQHLRTGFAAQEAPVGFGTALRPYQAVGLGWLTFLAEMGWGGVLADDMGLGKTVQVLAHLLDLKQKGELDRPALVAVPASLLHNWQNEARSYAPDLKVVVLHGDSREQARQELDQAHIALTTYALLPRIVEELPDTAFSLAIYDEAQNLKNARSLAAQAARKIKADRALALTGTPLENHLGELWSIVSVAMPGLLGTQDAFRTRFQTPIEKRNDEAARLRLRALLAPILLRRLKSEVASDLPPKTETVVRLDMSEGQRLLYESIRATQKAIVDDEIKEKGLVGLNNATVLNALMRLRQACCEPALLGETGLDTDSAKRQYLMDRLPTLIDEGRRILIISSFTQVLEQLEQDLTAKGISYVTLTGDTPVKQRGAIVQRYQEDASVSVFLLALKAGGVGLNITAADTVFHYDPWWNPAAENQATDRAHRIGQDKPVFVYRLVCNHTLEEHILVMQARKSALSDSVLDGLGKGAQGLTENDIAQLLG